MIIRVHARGTLVVAAIRRAYAARAVTDPAPQLVAAWAGSGELADLEPAPRPGGYDTTRLAALLAEPMRAGATTPTRPVWRCTLELDPPNGGSLTRSGPPPSGISSTKPAWRPTATATPCGGSP
ncbi:hypothetical protein [Micromonospora aurantiaca (nom. illeg.)]|uniref:hypothetical protein n=1 Tax=Micromonospora aurantiaca (nom. illeg.) TaxID=47850 RepID=UPI000B11236E|nr:hypothetical protein [Micromonospora aurantiaca]